MLYQKNIGGAWVVAVFRVGKCDQNIVNAGTPSASGRERAFGPAGERPRAAFEALINYLRLIKCGDYLRFDQF